MFLKLRSLFGGGASSEPTELCVGDRVKTLDGLCTGVISHITLEGSSQHNLQKISSGLYTRALVVVMIARGSNRSGLPNAQAESFSQGLKAPVSATHEYLVFSALHLRRT